MSKRFALAVVTLFAAFAFSQEPPPDPRTKLEEFSGQYGVVIVKGTTGFGKIIGSYGSSVEVRAVELKNATSGTVEFGVTIEVTEGGRTERSHSSFVDLDEVDSLLAGLDYVIKLTKSSTSMEAIEATYRTKGDLVAGVFSTDDGIAGVVISGTVGKATSFLAISEMRDLRNGIATAKARLDQLKAAL